MKAFLFVAALLVVAVAAAQDNTYSSKYDSIDLDAILNNDRLIAGYIRCLLDKGRCTAEGSELKKNLPDALVNGCTKCTERQRDGAQKIIKHIYLKKPDDYRALEEKFDPDGIYRKKYEETIQEIVNKE